MNTSITRDELSGRLENIATIADHFIASTTDFDTVAAFSFIRDTAEWLRAVVYEMIDPNKKVTAQMAIEDATTEGVDADSAAIDETTAKLKAVCREVIEEMRQDELSAMTLKNAYA
jgi:hypothetical protein